MAKLSSILQQRFRKKDKPKMSQLAEKSAEGSLTVFSGVFAVKALEDKDKEDLLTLLRKYAENDEDVSQDALALAHLTTEVKAINNQAVILHGERIKKAQAILKKYREGAFTAWLVSAYGNRQTPYNFLQYYEFYNQMPKTLHSQIEGMPRQAIYTLASRDGSLEKKEEVVRNYKGETKEELISLIRANFPLEEKDGRRENIAETTLKSLQKAIAPFEKGNIKLTKQERRSLLSALKKLEAFVGACETYEL